MKTEALFAITAKEASALATIYNVLDDLAFGFIPNDSTFSAIHIMAILKVDELLPGWKVDLAYSSETNSINFNLRVPAERALPERINVTIHVSDGQK